MKNSLNLQFVFIIYTLKILGYHWDVSDWANASVTTDIAEVVGGSTVDAVSCHSYETSDYNYGSKVPGIGFSFLFLFSFNIYLFQFLI